MPSSNRANLAEGNVVLFPGTHARLERAIQAFDRRDTGRELFEEFRALSHEGVSEANYFLACMYEDGSNSVSKNLNRAFELYEQTASEIGYVEGYLAAARLTYHGGDIDLDHAKAFKYYSHVARNSKHPVAAFMLGRMHQRGEGTKKDVAAARAWYAEAIARGSVFGMLNLALLEAEQGNWLKSLWWRLKAGSSAFLIALRDRRDMRLRGG